jgi:hypothetical protein
MIRIELTDPEVERLAEILNRAFSPTPALRKALWRLKNPKRRPPELRWRDERSPSTNEDYDSRT